MVRRISGTNVFSLGFEGGQGNRNLRSAGKEFQAVVLGRPVPKRFQFPGWTP